MEKTVDTDFRGGKVRKPLSWTFHTDGPEGVPYIQCPYCSRKIGGDKILFMPANINECPDCKKSPSFDNLKEEDYLAIREYYGRE